MAKEFTAVEMDVLNFKAHHLMELKEEADRISKEIKVIEDFFKSLMTERDEYEIHGDDWKLTWNMVTSNRFDQSAFKNAHPRLFESFKTVSESRRFLFSEK